VWIVSDEIPPEVMAMLKRVWQSKEPLVVSVKPRDAWTAVAVIQFACRNPHLPDTQRQQAIAVGRALQAALASMFPDGSRYLEDGWNPAKDVPR
jgi:hypothetical protein